MPGPGVRWEIGKSVRKERGPLTATEAPGRILRRLSILEHGSAESIRTSRDFSQVLGAVAEKDKRVVHDKTGLTKSFSNYLNDGIN